MLDKLLVWDGKQWVQAIGLLADSRRSRFRKVVLGSLLVAVSLTCAFV